jgi:hypothetical protein
MLKVIKNEKSRFRVVSASMLASMFFVTMLLSPNLARAEGDGDRTWRKGHCFLDKNEEICRRKKEGDTCPGANYCDGSTYLDTAVKVAKIAAVVL